MSIYRRPWIPGATCFFTVNLYDRRRSLLIDHIDALRAAFRIARAARSFDVIALAVMPDHLHCIWRLPEGDADNAVRWRHIKTVFTRRLPEAGRRSARPAGKAACDIWQRRYRERLVRDEHDLRTHVDYVHFNPVKHGLVDRVHDWPHSTFHRHAREGTLPVDWGAAPHVC